ncbi:MAG: tRNA epoxyqueuosine(34) reductase QueG [Pseudomonadota bacterium]
MSQQAQLKSDIQKRAKDLGFSAIGFAQPDALGDAPDRLRQFLDAGWHGDMEWLETHAGRRSDPRHLMGDVGSVIMLGMNYGPEHNPLDALSQTDRGIVSAYAKGRDYHDVLKGRLKEIAQLIAARTAADVKVFVDTAPLMEKPFAQAAGFGWQGKHTNLVSPGYGSWLLLGAILTSHRFEPDEPQGDQCGSCRACLDICPTDAFPAPYQLDARRCIAYLTIEYAGVIPEPFRKPIGNRVFGCDDCLAVCPWNKFAEAARETKLRARAETDNPKLSDLLAMDDPMFRKRFAGTPVKRTGRDRVVRNALIAAGNSGDGALLGLVTALLEDPNPVVRGSAVWAYAQLADDMQFAAQLAHFACDERDSGVIAEWQRAAALRQSAC